MDVRRTNGALVREGVCDMQEENRLDIRGMELHTTVISGLFSLTL